MRDQNLQNSINKLLRKIRWFSLPAIKLLFFGLGKSWNDFYGWMLDYQDRKVTLEQILSRKGPSDRYKGLWHWEVGENFLKYMVKHGLRPHHTVLDLGCGYGRCAIPIMKYQNKNGKYIGSEISRQRLALAKQWIEREGLAQ